MWVLFLNDMRSSNVENLEPVFRAANKEDLEILLEQEKADREYLDGKWRKHFKQGGPLEWFNPLWEGDRHLRYAGTKNEWMNDAAERYEKVVMSLPLTGGL